MPRAPQLPQSPQASIAHAPVSSRQHPQTKIAVHDKVLLPVVQRMINQLDSLFVEFVGPVGMELAEDVYTLWLKTGKTGPSSLRQYAYALSVQLDNPAERQQFTEHADHLLLQLQSGYVR